MLGASALYVSLLNPVVSDQVVVLNQRSAKSDIFIITTKTNI